MPRKRMRKLHEVRRPVLDMRPYREAIEAKLDKWSAVDEHGCRVWNGSRTKSKQSYGYTSFRNQVWFVHRLLYAAVHGPFEATREVCHTCDNPRCTTLAHLWLGDAKLNALDKIAKGRHHNGPQETCPRGHPYSGENLYVAPSGWRNCRTCMRARLRIKDGWPEQLAYATGVVPHGHKVFDGTWTPQRRFTGSPVGRSDGEGYSDNGDDQHG